MLASFETDLAAIFAAGALLVFSLTVLLLVERRGFKSISVDTPMFKTKLEAIDKIAKEVQEIQTKVDQVNVAVNHQPAGARTLVQRMIDVEQETRAHRAWESSAMKVIAMHLGIELPPPPDGHVQQEEHS